jgi:non-heme chloroperoxidase
MAGDVLAFMDALDLKRAVVAGHSMGSLVAQQLAVERPDRVAGLVLMAAFATIHGREDIAGFIRETILPLSDPIDEGFAREWQVSTLARPVDPALLDTVVAETLKVPARVWHATFDGFLDTPDVLERLKRRVRVPVLLAWGDRDTYALRDDQDQLLAALPHARLRVYEGGGHAFHWEDPAGFAAELEAFVGETQRGGPAKT